MRRQKCQTDSNVKLSMRRIYCVSYYKVIFLKTLRFFPKKEVVWVLIVTITRREKILTQSAAFQTRIQLFGYCLLCFPIVKPVRSRCVNRFEALRFRFLSHLRYFPIPFLLSQGRLFFPPLTSSCIFHGGSLILLEGNPFNIVFFWSLSGTFSSFCLRYENDL